MSAQCSLVCFLSLHPCLSFLLIFNQHYWGGQVTDRSFSPQALLWPFVLTTDAADSLSDFYVIQVSSRMETPPGNFRASVGKLCFPHPRVIIIPAELDCAARPGTKALHCHGSSEAARPHLTPQARTCFGYIFRCLDWLSLGNLVASFMLQHVTCSNIRKRWLWKQFSQNDPLPFPCWNIPKLQNSDSGCCTRVKQKWGRRNPTFVGPVT